MTHILLSRSILGEPWIVSHLKNFIHNNHRVVIIAFSFFPKDVLTQESYDFLYEKGGAYYDKMIAQFLAYGIRESNIQWIHYYKDTTETAIKKIKSADILYFPGGAPDLMMQRIHAFGIQEAIEAHQGLFIGSSAGSMIQFSDYHISKDGDYRRFSYEKGLNLLKGFSIEVHYDRKRKQKTGSRKVWRAFRHDIYAIPDNGCMVIQAGKIRLMGSARQLYDKTGIV